MGDQIVVSTKLLNQSIFIFVHQSKFVPYRIENRSNNHVVEFRQRDCKDHPWNKLSPGESVGYTWEEPMKPNKLTVRLREVNTFINHKNTRRIMKSFPFKLLETEDQGVYGVSRTIKLEEIGLRGLLPCPVRNSTQGGPNAWQEYLHCRIDPEGGTRVLFVSDDMHTKDADELRVMEEYHVTLSQVIEKEKEKLLNLDAIQLNAERGIAAKVNEKDLSPVKEGIATGTLSEYDCNPDVIYDTVKKPVQEKEIVGIDPDGCTAITSTNHVLVEVLEASGLNASTNSDYSGSCNPYCVVRLQRRSDKIRRNAFGSRNDSKRSQRTYYIEKTTSPKWAGMRFVYSVAPEAVLVPRGYSIVVKVKDFRLVGKSGSLGMTEIHLSSLKEEKEVVGWYPLMSRTDRGTENITTTSVGRVRGSVKLRVQWIHSLPALLDHYKVSCQNRVSDLETYANGMRKQVNTLKHAEQMNKDAGDILSITQIPQITRTPKSKKVISVSARNVLPKNVKRRQPWSRPEELDLGKASMGDCHPLKIVSDAKGNADSQEAVKDNSSSHDIVHGGSVEMPSEGNVPSQMTNLVFRDHFFQHEYSRSSSHTRAQSLDFRFDCTDGYSPSVETHYSVYNIEKRQGVNSASILYDGHLKFFHRCPVVAERKVFFSGREKSYKAVVPSSISAFKSWVMAYEILNDAKSDLYHGDDKSCNELKHLTTDPQHRQQDLYPTMILPVQVPSIMHERNHTFLRNLRKSRELFDQAAQRSLMAVLNPGGWLKIRPITALNLPQEKYNGAYVQVRYGSESCITRTVAAKVAPTWTSEKTSENLEQLQHTENEDPSLFEDRENDLEMKVEPLKTSGSLRLSVFGVRLNSKIELGVLEIPLSNALSCCTKTLARDEGKSETNIFDATASDSPHMYVRWFPLKDPKDCVPGDGDMGTSTRPAETEKTKDNLFAHYYTPCIKLAMWWEPEKSEKEFAATTNEESHDICMPEENNTPRPLTITYFQAKVESLSASLIDSFRARELLSFSSSDIDIKYSVTRSTTRIGFALGWVQLDHHNEPGIKPVVLSPTPVKNPQPTIQILAVKDNLRSKENIDAYTHIAAALEEMDFNLEEAWIFDVWEFFFRLLKRHEVMKKSFLRNSAGRTRNESIGENIGIRNGFPTPDTDCDDPNEILQCLNETGIDNTGKKQIFIAKLMLGQVKVNISYIKSMKRTKNESASYQNPGREYPNNNLSEKFDSRAGTRQKFLQEHTEVFRRWSEFGHEEDLSTSVFETAHNFPITISTVFPAITDAPVRVHGKKIDNVFAPWDEIFASLKHYYLKEIPSQIYKIIGSLDFVGNPTMVLSSFWRGAHDFVLQPFREFMRSPTNPSRIWIGFVKGALSLLSHIFTGVFGALSNISDAGGKALATLSLDDQFKRWHMQQVADHARHKHGKFRPKGIRLFTSSVTRPVQDIVAGVLFGAKGLFVEPYRGLKGNTGLAKGIGIGVIGLVAKPLVGIFDAFAHISESIEDVARSANILETKFNSVKKVRLRYVFGANNILVPFNPVDAWSATLLRLHPLENEKSSNFHAGKRDDDSWKEILVLSEMLQLEAGEAFYSIVTNKRIILFRVRIDGSGPPDLMWQVYLKRDTIIKVSIETGGHNGVALYIMRSSQKLNSKEDPGAMDQESQTTNMVSEVMNPLGLLESYECNSQGVEKGDDSKVDVSLPIGAFSLAYRASSKKSVDFFKIEGEFQHRSQLTRIHNAICCLTRQFESLLTENGIGTNGYMEGFTSFGYLSFDKNTSIASIPEDEEKGFYACLEKVPWVQGSRPCKVVERNRWSFSNELEVSKKEGGPQWIINSRAQAMFVPMPFPPLQSPTLREEQVQKLVKDLSNGIITFDQAKKELKSLVKIDSKINTLGLGLNQVYQMPNFVNQSQSDGQISSLVARTPFQHHPLILGSNDIGLNYDSVNDENEQSAMGERLGLVERILEQLLEQNNSPTMQSRDHLSPNEQLIVNQRVDQTITQNHPLIYSGSDIHHSGSSMISALSSGGIHGARDHTNSHQPSEIEALRNEVKMLKLALDEQNNISKVNKQGDTTSIGTNDRNKKKKRKKGNRIIVWR